jgi:FkbM family methyltransferase
MLRGVWLVASWHDYPAGLLGRTEQPLLDWFGRHVKPGQTWIDAGAHYGYTAFALARLVGREGRVFAFEPVAETAGCVERGRTLNGMDQVTALPLGLGAAATLETQRLAVTRGMADLTLSPSDRSSAAAAARPPHDQSTVLTARFDWLWPLINGGRPEVHGVKIDVQGMEIDVLEGMQDLLTRAKPAVVVEVHAGVDRNRLLELLRRCGYRNAGSVDQDALKQSDVLEDDRSYAFEPA